MHRVFQSFIDGLADSTDATDLQNVLTQAGGALDLSCFAYLSLPSRRSDRPQLISTYPTKWTDRYLKQRYERVDSYQFSDNLTHMGDSRIGVGLIQRGKQLPEVCYGRSYPASP